MSVDYAVLADNDPGGTLSSAFSAMAAQVVTEYPEFMITYRSVANAVGFDASVQLQVKVKSAFPSWVDALLSSDGIDVNNIQTDALVNSLVDTTFTQAMADGILAMGDVSVPVFPGLKPGVLADARRMRAEGRV